MKNLLSFFKIIQYLVITVLLIGILAFVVYLFVPSPSKTIRTFFIALRLQNYQKAYELIDGQYLKNRGSLETFSKDYSQAIESGTRTKNIRVLSVSDWSKQGKKDQKAVEVQVTVLFNGKITETYGTYVLENLPSKGWRIVENISHLNKKANTMKPEIQSNP